MFSSSKAAVYAADSAAKTKVRQTRLLDCVPDPSPEEELRNEVDQWFSSQEDLVYCPALKGRFRRSHCLDYQATLSADICSFRPGASSDYYRYLHDKQEQCRACPNHSKRGGGTPVHQKLKRRFGSVRKPKS